jgi:hypothetical protein
VPGFHGGENERGRDKEDVLVSIWIVIFTISLDAYFELICLWFTVSWRNSQGPSIILDKSNVKEDALRQQTQPNMHLTHSESKRRVLASFIFNEAFEDPLDLFLGMKVIPQQPEIPNPNSCNRTRFLINQWNPVTASLNNIVLSK